MAGKAIVCTPMLHAMMHAIIMIVSLIVHHQCMVRMLAAMLIVSSQTVFRSVLEQMLEAANWAPTHGRTEPWRFVVLSPDGLQEMISITDKVGLCYGLHAKLFNFLGGSTCMLVVALRMLHILLDRIPRIPNNTCRYATCVIRSCSTRNSKADVQCLVLHILAEDRSALAASYSTTIAAYCSWPSVLSQVMKSTFDESQYAKKKAKLESKAALYPRATFIAICSLRQVSFKM